MHSLHTEMAKMVGAAACFGQEGQQPMASDAFAQNDLAIAIQTSNTAGWISQINAQNAISIRMLRFLR